MKKYIVFASETVFYQIAVKAKNEEDAKDQVISGYVDVGEAQDAQGFEIERVEEDKELKAICNFNACRNVTYKFDVCKKHFELGIEN